LTATFTTIPGSNRLLVHDVVENLGGTPTEMQLLYHVNLGPPFLEAGSRFVAPVREVSPRDAVSAKGINTWDTFSGPTRGFVERAYFCDLIADTSGNTLAMLCNREADKALVVRFNRQQLPCLTLWHNTAAMEDGNVVGLEPGTSYPNFRGFERQRGRVRLLEPGRKYEYVWSLEVLDRLDSVAAGQSEIAELQAVGPAYIHSEPPRSFSS
jgi:hypothetical protein